MGYLISKSRWIPVTAACVMANAVTLATPGAVLADKVVPEGEKPSPEHGPSAQQVKEDESTSWMDGFDALAFVDAYYNADWNMPDNKQANGTQGHRAYVRTHGFALSFAGLDVSYDHESIGATIALRFGPSAPQLIGQPGPGLGLEFLKQAYVTWEPLDKLTLDFGQFDTIYGAEVSESWKNINYTRGALYFLMQPFWHQGLRASYQVNDAIGLTGLVVNGVNQPFDADVSPDVGLQASFTPGDAFGAHLGYYGSLQPSGKDWAHFVDLVINGSAGPVDVVFNGDLGVKDTPDDFDQQVYWGLSLGARYGINEHFGVAVRGEVLSERPPDEPRLGFTNFADGYLATGTLTFEYTPIDNIIIRLDNRIEASDRDLFFDGDASDTNAQGDLMPNRQTYYSSVLGVVVKTN